MIKSTDLAYASGYIDGDGCFYIGKVFSENRERFRNMIVINSTEIENLNWFFNTFGGTLTSYKKSIANQKPLYRYVLRGKKLDIINGIETFLVEKREEFRILKTFRECPDKIIREKLINEMNEHKSSFNLIPNSIKEDVESIRNTIQPSLNDFAYLAGFIDSECCLNINRSFPKGKPNPTYKILLQCNNTKSLCFYWLSARFGGQFHFIDRSHYDTPHRNQMCWRLSAASLSKILDKIYPFLQHKKPVCEELMKFYETMVPLEGCISRNSPKFADYYRPILELRELIFHKIQSLNKKGI